MKKGYSLHIGLNKVNPEHYPSLKDLRGAVNDAMLLENIAENVFKYHDTRLLLDDAATSKNVLQILNEYANNTNAGDIVLITYSGHGGQMEDPHFSNKEGDEPVDETWCLFDRQLIDDELFEAFRKFKSGVRVVIFSDSCHSGTVARAAVSEESNFDEALEALMTKFDFRSKEMTADESADVFLKNKNVYKPIQEQFKDTAKSQDVKANIQLFAACQDNQIAFDGPEHGRFTSVLKNIIENRRHEMDLDNSERLFDGLRRPFSYPTPNYFTYGGPNPANNAFPFAVDYDENQSSSFAAPSEIVKPTSPKEETPDDHRVSIEFYGDGNYASKIFDLSPGGMRKILIKENNPNAFIAEFSQQKYKTIWSLIHQLAQKADELKLEVDIEPVYSKVFPVEDDLSQARGTDGTFGYLTHWFTEEDTPHPELGWHLDDEHSQLAAARDLTWERLKTEGLENVRIGHIDTGYLAEHQSLSHDNILKDLARTFIDKEKKDNPTADDHEAKRGDIHGHGTGTLGILAGGKIDPQLTEGIDIGYIGAIPFAEVVPMRTSDTVIILDTENFVEAIEYAIETKCEVVTMSMGGKSSKKMARVVDKAYEQGITIVTAAGNNITGGSLKVKLGPKTLIYPSKFPRVIAACGACYNHCPYDFEAQKKHTIGLTDLPGMKGFEVKKMQGNWGPPKAMDSALAAYTPNTPWLTMKGEIVKSGGGTSSATPQIAAAAALWIVNNKQGLKERGWYGTWKQVEAVRYALFNSADKSFAESEKYYGNGILKARDAIKNFPIEKIKEEDLVKSKKSKSSWLGVTSMVKLLITKQRSDGAGLEILQNTMVMEVQDILFSTKDGIELLEDVDLSEPLNEVEFERMREIVLASDASGTLKAFFQTTNKRQHTTL